MTCPLGLSKAGQIQYLLVLNMEWSAYRMYASSTISLKMLPFFKAGLFKLAGRAMSKPKRYKLKLSGSGISIDTDISEAIAQQIVVVAFGGDSQPTTRGVAEAAAGLGGPPGDAIALSEFITKCQAQRIPDKITAVAYYLKNYKSQGTFTKADLKQKFREAGETVSAHLTARDLTWAIKNKWIARDPGDHDRLYITGTGETAVNEKFSQVVKRKSRFKSRTRRRKKRR